MRAAAELLAVLVVGVLPSCEQPAASRASAQAAIQLRLDVPDVAYTLSTSERRTVRRDFDVDALQRLLQMVRPEWRREVLAAFQYSGPNQPVANLVQLDDPVLQSELEKVWAPHWAHYTLDGIRRELAPFPGKAAAERRLTSTR